MSDCNLCLDQLLEPDPPADFLVVNNNGSLAFFENGGVFLGIGQTELSINFVVPKISLDYTFNELAVQNTSDQNPFDITATVTSRTKSGFTVLFDTAPDTGNYLLRWEVAVTQV